MDVIKWQLNFGSCNFHMRDFEIMRMVSDQIALHSVQLPLFMEQISGSINGKAVLKEIFK